MAAHHAQMIYSGRLCSLFSEECWTESMAPCLLMGRLHQVCFFLLFFFLSRLLVLLLFFCFIPADCSMFFFCFLRLKKTSRSILSMWWCVKGFVIPGSESHSHSASFIPNTFDWVIFIETLTNIYCWILKTFQTYVHTRKRCKFVFYSSRAFIWGVATYLRPCFITVPPWLLL